MTFLTQSTSGWAYARCDRAYGVITCAEKDQYKCNRRNEFSKGNISRSRGQKHQNAIAYKNDKYGATVQVKKAKSKVHDGLCQRCKDVLEWKVKYNKYKTLTQPRKCVKCTQKNIKDAYHVVCKPCSLQLEICCKCGKEEEIIIPVNSHLDQQEEDEEGDCKQKRRLPKEDDLDSDDDFDFEEDAVMKTDRDSDPKKTKAKTAFPDVSEIHIQD
uniref:Chromosome 9 open reading frame 85 n=1 Tax=Neogobius melanostomus TaxID=47308 RepID=A0A8C6V076_9GOBI